MTVGTPLYRVSQDAAPLKSAAPKFPNSCARVGNPFVGVSFVT